MYIKKEQIETKLKQIPIIPVQYQQSLSQSVLKGDNNDDNNKIFLLCLKSLLNSVFASYVSAQVNE
jgi:hypothetical protein